MNFSIPSRLDYVFAGPTNVPLEHEAAAILEPPIEDAHIDISECKHFARGSAHDMIGERICLRVEGPLIVDYRATIASRRILTDGRALAKVPPHHVCVQQAWHWPHSISSSALYL